MLDNKKTKAGIHYTRYIMSWIASGGKYFGEEFENWLNSEDCTEEEIHDIMQIAMMGKMELEKSAERFIKNLS